MSFAFLLHGVTLAAITLPTVIGYNVVFGKGKVFHFGQVGLSLIAAYPLWLTIVHFQQNPLLGSVMGMVFALLTALLLARLSFRLEPDAFGVMSIALHLAILNVILNWQSVTRGALGVPRIPRWEFMATNGIFTIVAVLVAVAWIVFVFFLDRSRFGRALAALSEHEWYAESIGIRRRMTHTLAFLIAAAGAFITSMFFPSYLYLLSPSDYTFPSMIFIVMCIVAGGPGKVLGVTLATVLLILLKEGLRIIEIPWVMETGIQFVPIPASILGPVRLILFGLILFAAVWWRRDALFPTERRV